MGIAILVGVSWMKPWHAPVHAQSDESDNVVEGLTDAEIEAEDQALDIEDAAVDIFVAGGQNITLQENDSRLKYRGTWTAGQDGANKFKKSKVKKNNVRLPKFKADSISIYFRKSKDSGNVRVILRDLTAKTSQKKLLNLYAANPTYTKNKVTFAIPNPNHVYRLRAVVEGTKTSPATDLWVGFDKMMLSGGVILSPGPTNPPGGGGDGLRIPVGTKTGLTLTIGAGSGTPPVTGNSPMIRIAVKSQGIDGHPDIKVRLRIQDIARELTPAPTINPSVTPEADSEDELRLCRTAQRNQGEEQYNQIIMTAGADGIYHPKPGSQYRNRHTSYTVSDDGWLILAGNAANTTVSIQVKGEKHVGFIMEPNVVLKTGKDDAQNFDWTTRPIFPGDVPDPQEDNKQDCTINANDVSLVKTRIQNGGNATADDLKVADLDYNGVLNAADMALLTSALSTRPDEE